MTDRPAPLLRTIWDTARWAAGFRALENNHPMRLFEDRFALALTGGNHGQIAESELFDQQFSWVVPVRTYLIDMLIKRAVRSGLHLVVNLGAGFDVRPYRLQLPPSLRWIEVDAPDLLAHKESVLRSERPSCRLSRIGLDILNRGALRDLLHELSRSATAGLVITEGLLIYLNQDEVGWLAADVGTEATFTAWILDLQTSMLLRALQRHLGMRLSGTSLSLKFGPKDGLAFFAAHGWTIHEAYSMLQTAAALERIPAKWAGQDRPAGERAHRRQMDGFVCAMSRA